MSATPLLDIADAVRLRDVTVSASTGEKPQSKVWQYNGNWFSVLPDSSGTWVRRLDGNAWTSVLRLTPETGIHADVKPNGNLAHVLLYDGPQSQLATIEYVSAPQPTYQWWSVQPLPVNVSLSLGVETATIDLDSAGRLWLASDAASTVEVRWSDYPYAAFASPITIASGISSDDICAVTALPNHQVGVLWSDQNRKQFGFRFHVDGADPAAWSANEVPAAQSAKNIGGGMADDHIHLAVAANGTLYAAVKTSYDTSGQAVIGLLVRPPTGNWDSLYTVDTLGTRPILVLNEEAQHLVVIYTKSTSGADIVFKESALDIISFGPRQTLLSGTLNNVTSTKQAFGDELVAIATAGSKAVSIKLPINKPPPPPPPAESPPPVAIDGLVGRWQLDESGGTIALDSSGLGNHGTVVGNPTRIAGHIGNALRLNGTTDRVVVPASASLDLKSSITLAAWIQPQRRETQYVIKKARYGSVDGFELGLTSTGYVYVRFNQHSSGETLRVNSKSLHPVDGKTWMHVAATYDGATIRIYINGKLENSKASVFRIASNALSLGLGAQDDGYRPYKGGLDDVQLYNRALSADEIRTLASG